MYQVNANQQWNINENILLYRAGKAKFNKTSAINYWNSLKILISKIDTIYI